MYRLILLGALLPCVAFAESPATDTEIPEVPEVPMPVESGETLEPDITIIKRGDKTIQEYRLNGRLYKVKITPDIGPVYYMIDTDGDGDMEEVTKSDLEKGLNINQWEIFSW